MTRQIIVFLFLLTNVIFGQHDSIEIKGRVFSDKPEVRVQNAEIVLQKEGIQIGKAFSDFKGEYSLKTKRLTSSAELFVKVSRKTKSNVNDGKSYLPNKTIVPVDLSTDKKTIIEDFFLKSAIICYGSPEILFKKNSTLPVTDKRKDEITDSVTFNESIDFIYQILQDNPTIVIEVNAHCDSREKNQNQLSTDRANFVKKTLVGKGISQKRIQTVGCGSTQLLVPKKAIRKAFFKKKALRQLNQRASYKVLSFDYKD